MDYFKFIGKRRIFVLLGIVIIFLAFTIPSIKKPFVLDEVAQVEAGRGLANTRIPFRYYGEQVGNCLALEHPPVYLYLLALSFKIFGLSEFSARLVSVFFGLGTLFTIYFLCIEIFKNTKEKYVIALVSSFLYAINPLIIQGSLLVDIDGSLLSFVLMLFVYFFIRYFRKLDILKIMLLGALLTLIWWTKFQIVFLVITSLILFYIVRRDFKEGIIVTFSISLIGTLLFLFTWQIYTSILNLPFVNPFLHNFILSRAQFDIYNILIMLWSVKNILFWTTPPFFIFITLFFLQNAGRYLNGKNIDGLDYLFFYGLINLCFFSIIRPTAFGFPKYFIPIMPAFSIVTGYFIVSFALRNKKIQNVIYLCLFLAIILVIFNFLVLKDPFISHNIFYTKSITIEKDLPIYIRSQIDGLLFFIPSIIALVGFLILKHNLYKSIVASSILVLVVLSVYVDYVQAIANYSTNYAYGQGGILETGKYLNNHTTSSDTIIAPLTIGYYSGRNYFRSYPNHGDFSMDETISKNEIPYIVISPSEKFYEFSIYYKLDAEYGSFRIYKKNSSQIPLSREEYRKNGIGIERRYFPYNLSFSCIPYKVP